MVAVACVVWFWFGLVWGGAVGGRRRVERSKRRDGSGDRGGTSVRPSEPWGDETRRESNIEIDIMTSVRAAIDDGEFAGRSVLGLGQPRETVEITSGGRTHIAEKRAALPACPRYACGLIHRRVRLSLAIIHPPIITRAGAGALGGKPSDTRNTWAVAGARSRALTVETRRAVCATRVWHCAHAKARGGPAGARLRGSSWEVDGGDGGGGSLDVDMASRGLGWRRATRTWGLEEETSRGRRYGSASRLGWLPLGRATAGRTGTTVRGIIFSWDLYCQATNRTLWAILAATQRFMSERTVVGCRRRE